MRAPVADRRKTWRLCLGQAPRSSGLEVEVGEPSVFGGQYPPLPSSHRRCGVAVSLEMVWGPKETNPKNMETLLYASEYL